VKVYVQKTCRSQPRSYTIPKKVSELKSASLDKLVG